jgi:hypothetical protein
MLDYMQTQGCIPQASDRLVNIAHYAAWYGSIPNLDWINLHYPALLYEKDYQEKCIAHYAALGGALEVLLWIRKLDENLLYRTDNQGLSFIPWAYKSDSTKKILEWVANDPALSDLLLKKINKNWFQQISLGTSRDDKEQMAGIYASTLTHFEQVKRENVYKKPYASPLEKAIEGISWEVLLVAFQNVKITYQKTMWGMSMNIGSDFVERYQEIMNWKKEGATACKALFSFLNSPGNTNENSLKGLVVRELTAAEEIWMQYPKGKIGELIEAMSIILSFSVANDSDSNSSEEESLFSL